MINSSHKIDLIVDLAIISYSLSITLGYERDPTGSEPRGIPSGLLRTLPGFDPPMDL
jgi:hypothetical protein